MKFQTFSIVTGTAACQAKCPFCISKVTPLAGTGMKEPAINWRNFDKACRLAELAGATTAMLTGKGEPTLFPKMVSAYLKKLQEFNFPIIEMQSNGIAAGRGKLDDKLPEWYQMGLDIYAISVVHFLKERNAEIYTPDSGYIDLPATIRKLTDVGFRVRLATVLVRDYLDSPELVDQMIQFAKENGVMQLTLRPVNKPAKPLNGSPQDMAVYQWTDQHHISKDQATAIAQHLEKVGKPLQYLPHGGTVYDINGSNVCLTNSLTLLPDKEEMRQLIFFPEGRVSYDWQYEGARIL
jgi:molybdenum cofactor biosynthesis enzyme MoaA